MRKGNQQCAYCGCIGKVTRDHIPPRCLFSLPLPKSVITVPACARCHSQTSKDDEYFRLALQVREVVQDHPDVIKLRPALLRSLEKPEAAGMRKRFLGSIVPAEQVTPSGLLIKNVLALSTQMDRVDRVAARIVKGLFFHHKGCVLPGGYGVVAGSMEAVDKLPPDQRTALYESVLNPMLASAPVRIGNGVFSFWLGVDKSDPSLTCWVLRFYEEAGFLGLTFPQSYGPND